LSLDLSICWKISWEVLFINWFLKLRAWNLSDISRSSEKTQGLEV
jgi:hypothetical protein